MLTFFVFNLTTLSRNRSILNEKNRFMWSPDFLISFIFASPLTIVRGGGCSTRISMRSHARHAGLFRVELVCLTSSLMKQ